MDYKRPRLKDKLYGEMVWSEFDDDESCWYTRIKTETDDEFDLSIIANSQADFLAVFGTHATYQHIINRIDLVLKELIDDILDDARRTSKNKQHKKYLEGILKKTLRLYSIVIFNDLSSTVSFVERVAEDVDPDGVFYALIDKKGNFIEAGVEDL